MQEHQEDTPQTVTQEAVPWRLILRGAMAFYLVTLPACTRDAGHFGPGFFPLLAALVLVPLFAMVSASDALSAVLRAWQEKGRKAWAGAAMAGLIAMAYLGLLAYVIAEKSRG